MRSYLKTGEFTLPDGEALGICELSAGARRALHEQRKENAEDPYSFAAIAVQFGCPEYRSETVQAILDAFPSELLNELAAAVLKLSGISTEAEAEAAKN